MSDTNCPYCDADVEINHDDGYGYDECKTHQQDCRKCGKTFAYTTEISFHYETAQADCMNGGEHRYKEVKQYGWPEQRLTELKLLMLTTAYEQGVGKGIQRRDCNPYAADTDEHAAWKLGYEEGLDKPMPAQGVEASMIKLPEPVAWFANYGGNVYTEAQLKQAVRDALAQQGEQQPVCHGCGIPAGDVHMSTCKSGKWPSRVSNGDTAAPAPQPAQPHMTLLTRVMDELEAYWEKVDSEWGPTPGGWEKAKTKGIYADLQAYIDEVQQEQEPAPQIDLKERARKGCGVCFLQFCDYPDCLKS